MRVTELVLLVLRVLLLFIAIVLLLFKETWGSELATKLALLFSALSTLLNLLCFSMTVAQIISMSTRVPSSLEKIPEFLFEITLQLIISLPLIIYDFVLTLLSLIVLIISVRYSEIELTS